VGSPKEIKSHDEVSQEDVGNYGNVRRGPSCPKYQPNACRLGNEALDRDGVAGDRSKSKRNLNFTTLEPSTFPTVELSSLGEREKPGWKPEVPIFSLFPQKKLDMKKDLFNPFDWNQYSELQNVKIALFQAFGPRMDFHEKAKGFPHALRQNPIAKPKNSDQKWKFNHPRSNSQR
jgi:hypothetical protein